MLGKIVIPPSAKRFVMLNIFLPLLKFYPGSALAIWSPRDRSGHEKLKTEGDRASPTSLNPQICVFHASKMNLIFNQKFEGKKNRYA
jgi:hypothetical protein